MKRFMLIVFITALTVSLNALGTLRVESIKELPATHTNLEVYDADGKYAPVLLVKTELKGIGIQNVGRPTKHAPEYSTGDHHYKFYMNDNQRVVKITHSDYEPLEVRLLADFGINVKAQRVYELVLSNVPEKIYIPINIVTEPTEARIYIDGNDKGISETQKVFIGKHTIRIHKKGYKPIVAEIVVTESKTLFKYFLTEIEDVPIMIYSEPEGATVYIDNIRIGETPIASFYPDGKYTIKIEKRLYETLDEQIIIKSPKIEKRFILEPIYATLNIKTYPNATVYLNETKLDSLHNLHLEPMVINLKVIMPKAEPLEKRIILKKNEIITLDLFPNVKTGTIQVGTIPEDATIELSGDAGEYYTANEISNFKDIPVGKYELKVSKDGFKTYYETINLKEEKKIIKQIKLIAGNVITNMIFVEGSNLKSFPSFVPGFYINETKDECKKLINAGFTYKEIIDYIQPQIDDALKEGYSLFEIYSYLGIYLNQHSATLFKVNNKKYSIPDSLVSEFLKDNPDAVLLYSIDTIDNFYIGKYEVTFSEYDEFCIATGKEKPDDNGWGRNDSPVINVSWYDAVEYCNWLSRKENLEPCYSIIKEKPEYDFSMFESYEGEFDNEVIQVNCNFLANGYRLPTEAEWEFAAMGGIKSNNFIYSGSNNINEVAWYEGNSEGKTHSVKQKKSNELGIYDMSGNVYEWCWDYYDSNYYNLSSKNNPRGHETGSGRVIRGGGWKDELYFDPFSDKLSNKIVIKPVSDADIKTYEANDYNSNSCLVSNRRYCDYGLHSSIGFRICRNAGFGVDEDVVIKKSLLSVVNVYLIYIILALVIIISFFVVLLILRKKRRG